MGKRVLHRVCAALLAHAARLSSIAVANKPARPFKLDEIAFGYRDSGHMLYQASRASQEVSASQLSFPASKA
jgi:hypothetical protein